VRQIVEGVEVELQPVLRVQNTGEQVQGAGALPERVGAEAVAEH
jgi:hypothetical protein